MMDNSLQNVRQTNCEGRRIARLVLSLWWVNLDVVGVVVLGRRTSRLSISISEFCLQIENDERGANAHQKE